MNSRKSTPDIMGGLMSGLPLGLTSESENHKAIEQESNNVSLDLQENKAITPALLQASEQEGNNTIEVAKEKATFNLSVETLESLEEAWVKMRHKLRGTHRITKTLIVEKALEIALADLITHSEKSTLFMKLKQ